MQRYFLCFLEMQYMTESVAYLEAVESMQYYITFDSEWNPAVICLYDSDVATYQPYIDWLYTEETEGGPEEIKVTGYSIAGVNKRKKQEESAEYTNVDLQMTDEE